MLIISTVGVQLLVSWKLMTNLKKGTHGDLENCTFFP